MAYVGAFATRAHDPELCVIVTKASAGERVKVLRWSTGAVRTAKTKDVAVVPIREAIERLRCLLIAETPAGQEQLEGAADLVAAAYAYTTAFEDELLESSALDSSAPSHLAAPSQPPHNRRSPSQNPRIHPHGALQKLSKARRHVTPKAPSAEIFARKKDFIREGVIAELVVSNLAIDQHGRLGIAGTKVDLYRLIQVYCSTAGVTTPTKSLVLRRIHEMTIFLSQNHGGQSAGIEALINEDSIHKLWFDIQEMEP